MQSSASYEIENMYVQSLGLIFNNLKKFTFPDLFSLAQIFVLFRSFFLFFGPLWDIYPA